MPETGGRRNAARWAVLVGAGLALACGGSRLAPADAVAEVAGEIVPYADFEDYISARVGLDAASSSVVLSRLLDQFLDERLLRALALDEGHVDVGAAGWWARDALLASRQSPPITEEEIAAVYRDQRDSLRRPERVLLRQVLAEDSATAQQVAELLAQGEEFARLGARLGDGVMTNESEITREDLPPAFAERIFALEPGQVSEVVAEDYGYHVFQVVDRFPAELPSLAEARSAIVEQLSRAAGRRQLEQLVAEARGRYNVVVYARNLPFNYEGQYDSPNS